MKVGKEISITPEEAAELCDSAGEAGEADSEDEHAASGMDSMEMAMTEERILVIFFMF